MGLLDIFKRKKKALTSEKVKDYYEKWHQRYVDSFGDVLQSARTDEVDDYFKYVVNELDLQGGMRVLDAGCGVGGPAIRMARQADITVEGCTISPSQVETAQKLVAEAGLQDRITIKEGDFHYLDSLYPAEHFDAVVFFEALVHSEHIDMVLEAANKVLKPGGVIYIKDLFTRARPEKEDLERIERAVRNTDRYCCLTTKPMAEVERSLKKNGFKVVLSRELVEATNHDVGNAFVMNQGIDIYEGEPVTYLEWSEVKAVKQK